MHTNNTRSSPCWGTTPSNTSSTALFALFRLVKCLRLQGASLLYCSKLWSPARRRLTLVGFIKAQQQAAFPQCTIMKHALRDTSFFLYQTLNEMWQAVGSKTAPASCLPQVAATYTSNNNSILTVVDREFHSLMVFLFLSFCFFIYRITCGHAGRSNDLSRKSTSIMVFKIIQVQFFQD